MTRYYVARLQTTAMYGVFCEDNGQLVTWRWRKIDAVKARDRLIRRARKNKIRAAKRSKSTRVREDA